MWSYGPISAVHLLADVVGDSGVGRRLRRGELVAGGVGAAVGKQGDHRTSAAPPS
jgi:hypothetical protein